jgi:chromosome segregation ATPase
LSGATGPSLDQRLGAASAAPASRSSEVAKSWHNPDTSGREGSSGRLQAQPTATRDAPVDEPTLFEIARVARYGDPPNGILGAVAYTLHVFSRRRELMVALADARRLRSAAKDAADAALSRLGATMLDLDPDGASARTALAPIAIELAAAHTARQEASAHAQASERSDLTFQDARRGILERLEDARGHVGPLRDRETRLATNLALKEQDLARVRARLQRVDIELRHADTDAGDGPRLEALQAERTARTAEMTVAAGPVEALQRELAEVRRELGDAMGTIAQLEAELRGADDAVRRDEAARRTQSTEAQRALDAALVSLARAARAAGLDQLAGVEHASSVERKVLTLEDRERAEAVTARAVHAFDRPSVQKGAAILGAAALLILAMVVVAIVS